MTGDGDIDFLRRFVLARTGIVLSSEKRYLFETRLQPVAARFGLADVGALAGALRAGDVRLESATVDAITTNETLFFRDRLPFDQFRDLVLPRLAAARPEGRLRIWCAACSTGQEPYSLAMILDELAPRLRLRQVEIIATDISEKVLAQAREGLFSQFEVQRGLPIRLLLKHFTQEGQRWRLAPAIRRQVQFRPLNLLQPFRALGRFDVIFCRNVLIYFGEATKRDVLGRLGESLAADGYLVLGGAESVLGLAPGLAPHRDERGLYLHAEAPDAHRGLRRRA